MANPAFIMRTTKADDHFLYRKLNKIDQFDALRSSKKSSQPFHIVCLAFDLRLWQRRLMEWLAEKPEGEMMWITVR